MLAHNKDHLKATSACLDGIVRDMLCGNPNVEQRVDNIVALITIKGEEFGYGKDVLFTACVRYVSRELKRITKGE